MLTLIVILVLIAVLLYVVKLFIPLDSRIMSVIYVLIGLWLIVQVLGLLGVNVPYLSRLH